MGPKKRKVGLAASLGKKSMVIPMELSDELDVIRGLLQEATDKLLTVSSRLLTDYGNDNIPF